LFEIGADNIHLLYRYPRLEYDVKEVIEEARILY